MWTRQYKDRKMRRLVVPAITAAVLAYFALHAQSGKYGLNAKQELSVELANREAVYNTLDRQREKLEKRVSLLHDGTLQRDMLDEQARRALNLSSDDEITLLR